MSDLEDVAKLAAEIEQRLNAVEQSLPKEIDAARLTLHSKLPFKAACIRGLLFHRFAELARVAFELFRDEKLVSSALVTRASMETIAALFRLHNAILKFLETGDEDAFDEVLMRGLVGARWPGHPVQSTNVMTLVEQMDKDIPAFLGVYSSLSEYSHPNYSGLLCSFGTMNHDQIVLELGRTNKPHSLRAIANALAASLGAFVYYYNKLTDQICLLNEHYESRRAVDRNDSSV